MIFGQEAVFDCKSIGDPVDAAYLCVPREGILKAARDAIDAGIRNLVVITAGFAEVGGEGAQLEVELKALCESNGVNALGPNCLGFRNILDRVGLGSIPFMEQHAPGTIALVTVSGSVANAVASYGVQQGIGFTHLISTGNEMNTSAADLVDYLVDIPEVKAITLFLEAVKDPATLAVAAERARTARKPIVALKAGFAPATAAIAAAHTSAVLGDDRVFDAACDRLGIIRVSTFEEMITTAAAIVETGPVRVPGVAVISMSGGVCEVASDYGAELGVVMPQFSEATRYELDEVLSDLGQANNPLDLTGAAVRDESLWTSVTSSVSRDPAIGLILLNWEVPATAEPRLPITLAHIGNARNVAATPTVIVASYERPVNEHGRAYLSEHGLSFTVPGLRHAMTAAAHLAWWSERRAAGAGAPGGAVARHRSPPAGRAGSARASGPLWSPSDPHLRHNHRGGGRTRRQRDRRAAGHEGPLGRHRPQDRGRWGGVECRGTGRGGPRLRRHHALGGSKGAERARGGRHPRPHAHRRTGDAGGGGPRSTVGSGAGSGARRDLGGSAERYRPLPAAG